MRHQNEKGTWMSTTLDTSPTAPSTASHGWRNHLATRNAWLVAGGLALTGLGLAAGLAWRPAPQTELLSPGSLEATRASLTSNEAVIDAGKSNDKPSSDVSAKSGTPVPLAAEGMPGASGTTSPQTRSSKTEHHVPGQSQQFADNSGTMPRATQQAAVCAHCGVVEAVREMTIKGKGTGMGAVAGGVLGGAVGNRMGHGNGRSAMTVLGALGGGFAGNEVEKRARSEKAYEVRVRMDDGSLRTFQQKHAPAAGARVTVDGKVLHVTRSNGDDAQMTRPSTGV